MARKHADIDASELDAPDREADGGFQRDGLFVFDAEPMVRNWPVKVRVPAEGGSFVHHQVRMDFAWLDLAGYERLVQDVTEYAKANPESGQAGGLGAPGDPLLPVVQEEAVVIIDDYYAWDGCSRAVHDTLSRVLKARRALARELAREPTHEELAKALELSTDGLRQILRYFETPLSLDAPLHDDGEATLGDRVEDPDADDPLAPMAEEELEGTTRQALAELPEREAYVLRRRFGLGCHEAETLEQIGRELDVTRESVRQIQLRALRRLRRRNAFEGFVS